MRLKTKRLILRSPAKKDLKDLVDGLNNLEVSRTFGVVPHPYTTRDALRWINKCSKEFRKKERESYQFGIELKSERKLVGVIGLNHIDYFNEGTSISYWVNKKYWKQGIASEAMKPVIGFAFNKLKLRRLYLFAYDSNESSNNFAKKFGFTLEGTLRKSHKSKATGEIYSANMYGLLKEDWIKLKKTQNKK